MHIGLRLAHYLLDLLKEESVLLDVVGGGSGVGHEVGLPERGTAVGLHARSLIVILQMLLLVVHTF